jgi:hypothetical protein
MSSIGWKVGKETYSYEEALQTARNEGLFHGYPPAALRAMRRTRVDGHWLSPSAAGDCPRKRVLEPITDYYQDLVGSWSPSVGTAVHDWLERAVPGGNGGEGTELFLNTKLLVPLRDGRVVPFMLQGTVDYYDFDSGRAYDYKTVSEFDYWHRGKRERVERDIPSANHVLQANLYKYLLEMSGAPVKEYILWYVKLHSDGQRKPVVVDLWENEVIEQIACEIAEPLAWYEATGELPKNRFDSKNTWCRFCPVTAECRALAKEGK